jgi:DNA-binding response OmpR family regulator
MWQGFVKFWDTLGWVANLIEIVSAGVLIWLFLARLSKKKKNINKFTYKNLSELVKEKVKDANVVKINAIKNARIAIVDDNPSDFPLEYLKKLNLNIEVIEKTSLTECEKFSKYDLVMLDIAGVVIEDLREGGLDLIKRIDSLNKRPQIIAVSSKKFDPKASEFFNIADDVMSKPIREKECEEAIISLLLQKLSPFHASEVIDKSISGSNINGAQVIVLYKTLFKYVYGMADRGNTRQLLLNKYAFMDVEKLLNNLDVIKPYVGINND